MNSGSIFFQLPTDNLRKEETAMYRTLKSPISVQVEMTQQCNSSCLHCYNHWRKEKSDSRLDTASIKHIVEEFASNGVFDVTITGGEPLLQPQETILMCKLLKEAGLNFTMNSNLRLLSPNPAAELRDAGLKSILTSFVSHDRKRHAQITQNQNSYDQVIRGIQVAKEHGFAVAANMVLSRLNVGDLRETAQFLQTLGVENFCATKMSPPSDLRDVSHLLLSPDEMRESLVTLLEIKEELGINVDILECYPLCLVRDGQRFAKFFRRSCVAGVTACTVGSDGAVRPCSHAKHDYGNILLEPLETIWKRMDDWRSGRYIPRTCKDCQHLPACTGGCRIDAYVHGDISGLDPSAQPDKKDHVIFPDRPHAHKGVTYVFPPFNSRKENFGRVIYSKKACFPVNESGFKILNDLRFKSFFIDGFNGENRDFLENLVVIGFADPKPQ
ncbi:MAG: radical SAM protein [Patescibacteria group bacterium]